MISSINHKYVLCHISIRYRHVLELGQHSLPVPLAISVRSCSYGQNISRDELHWIQNEFGSFKDLAHETGHVHDFSSLSHVRARCFHKAYLKNGHIHIPSNMSLVMTRFFSKTYLKNRHEHNPSSMSPVMVRSFPKYAQKTDMYTIPQT